MKQKWVTDYETSTLVSRTIILTGDGEAACPQGKITSIEVQADHDCWLYLIEGFKTEEEEVIARLRGRTGIVAAHCLLSGNIITMISCFIQIDSPYYYFKLSQTPAENLARIKIFYYKE